MTKKDYVLIAGVINRRLTDVRAGGTLTPDEQRGAEHALFNVARGFKIQLATDNPRFDAGRFMGACGWPMYVGKGEK